MHAQIRMYGEDDCKKNAFEPRKALLGGLITQSPAIVLYIITILSNGPVRLIVQAILRVYLSPYMTVFSAFEQLMPHLTLLFIAIFPIGMFLSYSEGEKMHNKTLELIKRTEQERLKKSKTSYEG
jgi:hypothetical protein